MGATNVATVYALWAGKVPPTSMQLLVYMALVSKDSDHSPWFTKGHAGLAEAALGRPLPLERADIKAVERAIGPLLDVGAIKADRRPAHNRRGSSTGRYRLNLPPGMRGLFDIDVSTVEHPPESGGRKRGRSPGKRGT